MKTFKDLLNESLISEHSYDYIAEGVVGAMASAMGARLASMAKSGVSAVNKGIHALKQPADPSNPAGGTVLDQAMQRMSQQKQLRQQKQQDRQQKQQAYSQRLEQQQSELQGQLQSQQVPQPQQ